MFATPGNCLPQTLFLFERDLPVVQLQWVSPVPCTERNAIDHARWPTSADARTSP